MGDRIATFMYYVSSTVGGGKNVIQENVDWAYYLDVQTTTTGNRRKTLSHAFNTLYLPDYTSVYVVWPKLTKQILVCRFVLLLCIGKEKVHAPSRVASGRSDSHVHVLREYILQCTSSTVSRMSGRQPWKIVLLSSGVGAFYKSKFISFFSRFIISNLSVYYVSGWIRSVSDSIMQTNI